MKSYKALLIMSFILLVPLSLAAQFHGETQKVYEAALAVLQSDYAQQEFPPKTAKIVIEANLPDTITVDDNRLFNFSKSMRSKQGEVPAKLIPVVIKIINADSEITTEEKALLDAVKNNKELTVYYSKNSDPDYAVNLTFDTTPEAKTLLDVFYEKGIALNSFQHMHQRFIDTAEINNWLEYYYGSKQQKELATAFMHFKFLQLKAQGGNDYKRFTRLFKSFIYSTYLNFTRRDQSVYPEANQNVVLGMIKEFDEAGHIALPDFLYTDYMEK